MPDTRAPLVLTIDQGTTNSKALLVAADTEHDTERVLAQGSAAVPIAHPAPGWVEQDAAEVWASVQTAVARCLAGAPADVEIGAVAISSQRESVVAWRRSSGEPVGPMLGWQDARTAAACADLAAAGGAELVRTRTGLSLDPMFSAPKMRWLLDHARARGVDPQDLCLGTVDSWLVWNLTGGRSFTIEAGNASRTLLLDLRSLDWSTELLDLFGIPAACLPEVRASDAGFGVTAPGSAVPAAVPVAAVLADSHAALYHHGCTEPGRGKATYGTGSSVMTPAALSAQVPAGITSTLAWLTADGPVYAREGNIVASGSALDWVARTLGAPATTSGGAWLTELAAESRDGSGGVAFVPAFSGLGAPYWDRSATGILVGLTGGTTRAQIAYAALDAVAHQVADVIEAVESDGQASLATLHADGGATASTLLMQRQADLGGRPVLVADEPAASALGAARMAACALRRADPRTMPTTPTTPPFDPGAGAARPAAVRPVLDDDARREERARWHAAVARSRGHALRPA